MLLASFNVYSATCEELETDTGHCFAVNGQLISTTDTFSGCISILSNPDLPPGYEFYRFSPHSDGVSIYDPLICDVPDSPCDSAEPKLIKVTDILNLFPSHKDSDGCWWSPDHSTMTVITDSTNCTRDGCQTIGYYNYNSSSTEPVDGDPSFTPPAESFVDELPPPVLNASADVEETIADTQITQVLDDGTAISTSTSTERSSNVDTTVTDSVDDVTVTTVKSPEVVKTTTETVISNVDNSSSVTTTTNTTINSSTTDSTTYSKDGTAPNSISTESSELSNTTTTTTSNYDGDGNYTGGTSDTSNPEPDDPNEPNYKAPKKTKNYNDRR